MFDIQEHLKKLPSEPGVYLMKDKYDHIIYVGKAISLKNRVRQYFQSSKNHTSKVKSMVKNIYKFEYIITDSELEALILECNLIKRYRPKYNVVLRDDKTYPYIKVTTNEDYPRILKVRRVLKDKAKYFGPYTNITAVNDTLELISSTYPIRSCKIDIDKAIKNKTRPCLNLHINKCLGPCTGNVSKEEYGKMIEEIIMCLSGKEEKLMELLKEKMNESSMNFRFEEAAVYRDKIKSLEEMIQKQKIDATVSDLNQDVVAMARAHNEACVQVFFIRNGKIVGREHFIFSDMNKRKYEKSIGALEELKQILNLEKLPIRIEAYDISNIQGVDSIGSMVVYTNAKKDKKEYRRYKIKTVIGPNDYDSMAEIVDRRLKHGNLPDLILLDGGKGQVSAVKKVLELNDVDIPLWGMYKDDKHRTKGLICKEKEIELDKTTNLYRFIASIQEEVHNYAITYHRSLRNKALTKSILDDIQGIGEKRKKSLLNHFKDVDAIKKATMEELLEVDGMNKSIADNVYNFFRKEEN